MANQIKVLFICTGNCCRSQMAEALLRHLDPVRFSALSAGSHPAGYIHPLAVAALEALQVSVVGQRSKSWEEFENTPVDVVITLCDSVAGEACPAWPNAPATVHWPFPDPVLTFADESERVEFAVEVARQIKEKIERLVAIDFSKLSRTDVPRELERIGRT